jgi:hypothetical protein
MRFSALMSHLEPTRVQLSPLEMPAHQFRIQQQFHSTDKISSLLWERWD